MKKTLCLLLVVISSAMLFTPRVWAASYTVADVATFVGSGEVTSINDHGTVVGSVITSPITGSQFAFTWSASTGFAYLDPLPGYVQSSARGINDSGQVVGYSQSNTPYVLRASLWEQGKPATDIGAFPSGDYSPGSVAKAINNAGQVVGNSTCSDGHDHGFVWTAGADLQDLGTDTSANGINDHGTVVGTHGANGFIWDDANGMRDFSLSSSWSTAAIDVNNSGQVVAKTYSGIAGLSYLWQEGHDPICLGTLSGSSYAVATDINNLGQIIGLSNDQPFVWDSVNGIQALPSLAGLSVYRASAINDNGTIAGYAYDDQGNSHLLIWSVPEPSSLFALLAGIGSVCSLALKRRRAPGH